MNDQRASKTVWPALNCDDAHATIKFLIDAFGFEQTAVYDDDQGRVAHAELRWPEGGGIMLGDAGRADSVHAGMPTGCASVYVVTDEPDAVHARALSAGAQVIREMRDEDYGSRGFSVRDPEGNIWSFGSYRGE
jgi:uncharacterized glyoxalase superfamily protein PhnB